MLTGKGLRRTQINADTMMLLDSPCNSVNPTILEQDATKTGEATTSQDFIYTFHLTSVAHATTYS